MTRKIKSGALALVLGLTVCFGALAQMPVPAAETASPDDPMLQLQKLNQFYRYLNGTYVDTVHNDALVEKAIREMLTFPSSCPYPYAVRVRSWLLIVDRHRVRAGTYS